MFPLSVAVIVGTKELWEDMQPCMSQVRILFEQAEAGDLRLLLEKLQRMSPDVVLLDIAAVRQPLDQVISSIKSLPIQPLVFTVNSTAEPELILAAMRAGTDEYLHLPIQDQLIAAFARASSRIKDKQSVRPGGTVVGFVSAKGGCGSTTLACHVAVEIAAQSKRKTLLADLDLSTGIVSFLLKGKSVYSIADAASNLQRLDPSYWRAIVSNGIPDFEFVSAPATPAAKTATPEALRHVVAFARSLYEWVVLDLGRGVDRSLLTVLENVDEVYVVTTVDVPALHQAKKMIQTLMDSGYRRDRIRLVLNRMSKRCEINEGEIETMLAVPVSLCVPEDFDALDEAYSDGKLVPAGSSLGKHYSRLARKITKVEEPHKKRFSLFG